MNEPSLQVLVVVGSLNQSSVTRAVLPSVANQLRDHGCAVDLLDFAREPLALFNPEEAHRAASFTPLRERVERADVFLLGTPDYHGSMSSVLKNFLDHFWQEFAGKLFATVVSSYEKGLTVTDQLRTVARQCYAWSLPYGVAFSEREDWKDGQIASDAFRNRLEMFVRDLRVYGSMLARQRSADLLGADSTFMARYRKPVAKG